MLEGIVPPNQQGEYSSDGDWMFVLLLNASVVVAAAKK